MAGDTKEAFVEVPSRDAYGSQDGSVHVYLSRTGTNPDSLESCIADLRFVHSSMQFVILSFDADGLRKLAGFLVDYAKDMARDERRIKRSVDAL